MDEVMMWSLIAKLIKAGLAVVLLYGLTRLWNYLTGSRFSEAHALFIKDPVGSALYYGLKLVALALVVVGVVGCTLAQGATIPGQFDRPIERAASDFLPGVPWKLLKAQYYQESRLDPTARSPVGAAGIAQFMPSTWREIMKAMGRPEMDRSLAEPAIEAGAFYMARLRKGWSSPRPWQDRHKLALASYNAGLGNILGAQHACRDPPLYADIMACLPEVTGAHATETLGYAPTIWRWWQTIEATP